MAPPTTKANSPSHPKQATPATHRSPKKTILFLHPDLGIGGAERLILDAALGLQSRGHDIVLYTSHRDPQHCFPEANDPAVLDVRVRGNTLFPSSLLGGRFTILCAVLRQLHLLVGWALLSDEMEMLSSRGIGGEREQQQMVFVVDQLAAGVPVLKGLEWVLRFWRGGPWPGAKRSGKGKKKAWERRPPWKVLFYCHFPDLLLVRGREKWWKRAYRVPFDALEGWSMGFADAVCVNSAFTRGIVGRQWPELVQGKELEVVYPCVDVKERKAEEEGSDDESLVWRDTDILLSINRFEKKKDVGLAIRAYAGLGKHGREGVRLVVAGGYDNRVQENVTYHKELIQLADSLGLKHTTTKNVVTALGVPDDIDVLFLLSVPNSLKDALLKSARLLIYTPSNEHFGIVPLEAMLAGTPVLAANTGGPLETVVNGVTGWLCPPDDVQAWTGVMDKVLHKMSDAQLQKMSEAGKQRVMSEFSDVKMAERLDDIIDQMSRAPRASSVGLIPVLAILGIAPLVVLLVAVSLWKVYGS